MKDPLVCSNCNSKLVISELSLSVDSKRHLCKKCWDEVGSKVNKQIQEILDDRAEVEYRSKKRSKPKKFIEEVYEISKGEQK